MNELNLIRFNDDNHAERIFLNGTYVGTTNDIGEILKKSVNIIKDLNDDYKFIETVVYVCDDFDEFDEDDEIVENIWNFFNEVEKINEKQRELIKEKNWIELNKNI